MKIKHPVKEKTEVIYEGKGCNCAKVKSKPLTGKIQRARDHNGTWWYFINGKQYHQSMILKVGENEV